MLPLWQGGTFTTFYFRFTIYDVGRVTVDTLIYSGTIDRVRSVPPDVLKGPLSGYNALSCDNSSQLYQLINDVADILEITPEKPAAYERYVEKVLSIPPAKVKNSSQDGDEVLEFERRSGTFISKTSGIRYCHKCYYSTPPKRAELQESQLGWECSVCGKFYRNPDFNPPKRDPYGGYNPLRGRR